MRVFIAVAVVIVVVMIAIAVVLTTTLHKSSGTSSSGTAGTILDPEGLVFTLGYTQFGGTSVNSSAGGTITGSFLTSNTVSLYLMTPAQFAVLVKNITIPGFEWTMGPVWSGNLSVPISAGAWEFVFDNQNRFGSTEVLISTNIVFTPTTGTAS